MIEPFALVVLVLAAFRLTTLGVYDTILDRPRAWTLKRFPETGTYVDEKPKRGEARYVNESQARWWVDKGTFIGDLITCHYCLGVWVSIALGLAWYFVAWTHLPIILAAIAGGQLLLSHLERK